MAEILVEKLGVPALYLANKVTIFVVAKDCLDFRAFARLKLSHITHPGRDVLVWGRPDDRSCGG